MAKLTEKESHVVRWLLREADSKNGREPRPPSATELWIWLVVGACALVLAALLVAAIGAWAGL